MNIVKNLSLVAAVLVFPIIPADKAPAAQEKFVSVKTSKGIMHCKMTNTGNLQYIGTVARFSSPGTKPKDMPCAIESDTKKSSEAEQTAQLKEGAVKFAGVIKRGNFYSPKTSTTAGNNIVPSKYSITPEAEDLYLMGLDLDKPDVSLLSTKKN